MSYPELNTRERFIFPPTTPIQFDPEAWHASIDRLQSLQPERIFVTHFGMHENPQPFLETLHRIIDEYVAIALHHAGTGQPDHDPGPVLERDLMRASLEHLDAQGCALDPAQVRPLLKGDMELNAKGLANWLTSAA